MKKLILFSVVTSYLFLNKKLSKIMDKSKELDAAIDSLAAKQASESGQVKAAVSALKDEIAILKQAVGNGTPDANVDAAISRINAIATEMDNIYVADPAVITPEVPVIVPEPPATEPGTVTEF